MAEIYASVESKRINRWYSTLIDNEINAVNSIDEARSLNMQHGLHLYRLIGDADLEHQQVINQGFQDTRAECKARMADDAAAPDLVVSAQQLFSKGLTAAEIELLARQVGNFVYAEALQTLSNIAERLSLNLE